MCIQQGFGSAIIWRPPNTLKSVMSSHVRGGLGGQTSPNTL